MKTLLAASLAVAVALVALAPAGAVVISTQGDATIDGQSFLDGDLVDIPGPPEDTSLFLSESIFSDNECIDAAALVGGTVVLSTTSDASIGGLSFINGDLVQYDPWTATASLFLSEAVFGTNVNVDALHVLGPDHVLVSFWDSETISGTTYSGGDVVEYDGGSFSLFLSESIFDDGDANIDALAVLPNGIIQFSTLFNESIGGVSFDDAMIVSYDPVLDEVVFIKDIGGRPDTSITNLDAIAAPIPEPSTLLLLGAGLLGLAARRRLG